jgi:hypothetical protein
MNKIFIDANIAGDRPTRTLLPVITLKTIPKKKSKPDKLRYKKKPQIYDYQKILTVKSLNFNLREKKIKFTKNPSQCFYTTKNKSNTVPVIDFDISRSNRLSIETHPAPNAPEIQILFRDATPELKAHNEVVAKGAPMTRVESEDEPSKSIFIHKQNKMKVFPDILPLKPVYKNIEFKTEFKLVQEDVSSNKTKSKN